MKIYVERGQHVHHPLALLAHALLAAPRRARWIPELPRTVDFIHCLFVPALSLTGYGECFGGC